ncbi:hypothetical protein YC2023_080632 [Brassica napus]
MGFTNADGLKGVGKWGLCLSNNLEEKNGIYRGDEVGDGESRESDDAFHTATANVLPIKAYEHLQLIVIFASIIAFRILNEFLDLKGNIRVFCRVKPLDSRNLRATVASDTRNVIITLTESKRKTYNFDRVFEPDSSQGQVALIFFFWRLSSSLRLFHYDVDTVTYR